MWFRLYYTSVDREDSGAELYTVWDFYWEGSLISINTITIDRRRSDDGVCYGYLKILRLEIPKEIEQYKKEIFKDLKEAFEASLIGLGVYATKTKSCKVDLEYKGELI
jgi:hypothetical protein